MDAAEQMHAQNHYDVVIPYYIRTAEAAKNLTHTRKIVAIQLSLAAQWKRAAKYASNPLVKAAKGMEARRLAAYEGDMFEEFNKCLVISNHDLKHMAKVDPAKVFFNPHGVDTVKFAPRDTAKKPGSIVFSGAMAFQPNEDAVCYFAETAWPRVRAAVPHAIWTIVGKNPTAKVAALARLPGVTVTGTVAKVEDYLAQAEVAINPLRIGGGLQNKLLEGMSMGLPMVASSVANEGIGAIPGEHLLLADQPGEFADHVISLFGNKAKRETLGQAARKFIEDKWTWEYHFARLENLLEAETSLSAN
jgi:glycosyltransferase involved in cell wall biosynthesis